MKTTTKKKYSSPVLKKLGKIGKLTNTNAASGNQSDTNVDPGGFPGYQS